MSANRYRAADFFLLRAAVTPLQELLDFYDQTRDTDADELLDMLVERAIDSDVHRALWIASPDLVAAMERSSTMSPQEQTKRQRKARRALRSRLLRYHARSASRATPFGAFAGIGWGSFSDVEENPTLPPTPKWRQRARSDIAWVLDLVRQVEEDDATRASLLVRTNSLSYISGGRVVLPVADTHGTSDTRRISIRYTDPVEWTLDRTSTGPTLSELETELAAQFPNTPPDDIQRFVCELWDLHFLTSDLRPSLAHPRADKQLLHRLDALAHLDSPLVIDIREALREVVTASEADNLDVATLRRLAERQKAVAAEHSGVTLQVDMSFGAEEFTANVEIQRSIERGFQALTELAAVAPRQKHHLERYRAAFLERYGYGAVVPVLDLLSPEDGIGAPETYENPPRPFPLENAESFQVEERDEYNATLAALLIESAKQGRNTLELDDIALKRLRGAAPAHGKPLYPLMDAYVQVGDVDGAMTVRLDTFAPGGRTFGRFSDLLPETAIEQLRTLVDRWQQDRPDAVIAELCYLPAAGHATNVATRPLLCDYEVTINSAATAPSTKQISLRDLSVGIADERFFLWSTRLGKEVVVLQSHMLNEQMAHNVARFLLEVSADGYHLPVGFSWGGLESMPSLPRVVYGNAILAAASWRVPTDLVTDASSDQQIRENFTGWRLGQRVPDLVYVADDDNRLLLDLTHPACLSEIAALMRQARSHGRGLQIEEVPFDTTNPWVSDVNGLGHVSEIVVPLVRSRSSAGVLAPVPDAVGAPDVYSYCLPGDEWVFIKVYASVEQQEQIIAEALPAFISLPETRALHDRWFFIRYLDPRPHLRIRLRARDAETKMPLLVATVRFASELVRTGLASHHSLVPYAPERGRYGGDAAYDIVEGTFEQSSWAAVEAVRRNTDNGGDTSPEIIGVTGVLALYTSWGYPWASLFDVLPEGQASERARELFRSERARLATLGEEARLGAEGATGETLFESFLSAFAPLRTAGDVVRTAAEDGRLQGSERDILRSLAHMLINRSLPVDLDREAGIYHLTREAVRVVNSRHAARERVI